MRACLVWGLPPAVRRFSRAFLLMCSPGHLRAWPSLPASTRSTLPRRSGRTFTGQVRGACLPTRHAASSSLINTAVCASAPWASVLLGVVNRVEVAALLLALWHLLESQHVGAFLGPRDPRDQDCACDHDAPEDFFFNHGDWLYRQPLHGDKCECLASVPAKVGFYAVVNIHKTPLYISAIPIVLGRRTTCV